MSIKFLGGLFIIVTGIILMTSSIGLGIGGESFQDTYPVLNEWNNSGTHDNTFSDANGNLLIDNLTTDLDTGTFTSNVFTNGEIEVNNIVYEAENIVTQGSNTRSIELVVRGVNENGAIIDESNYTLENGKYSIPVETLQNNQYNGYQFVVNMEAEDNESALLNELTVSGENISEDQTGIFSQIIGMILIVIGMMVLFKDVF